MDSDKLNSILKPEKKRGPLSEVNLLGEPPDEHNERPVDSRRSLKRVSFSRRNSIKPFTALDGAEKGTTLWDLTYEEMVESSGSSGSNTHMQYLTTSNVTGIDQTATSRICDSLWKKTINQNEQEENKLKDLNKTTMEMQEMEFTEVVPSNIQISKRMQRIVEQERKPSSLNKTCLEELDMEVTEVVPMIMKHQKNFSKHMNKTVLDPQDMEITETVPFIPGVREGVQGLNRTSSEEVGMDFTALPSPNNVDKTTVEELDMDLTGVVPIVQRQKLDRTPVDSIFDSYKVVEESEMEFTGVVPIVQRQKLDRTTVEEAEMEFTGVVPIVQRQKLDRTRAEESKMKFTGAVPKVQRQKLDRTPVKSISDSTTVEESVMEFTGVVPIVQRQKLDRTTVEEAEMELTGVVPIVQRQKLDRTRAEESKMKFTGAVPKVQRKKFDRTTVEEADMEFTGVVPIVQRQKLDRTTVEEAEMGLTRVVPPLNKNQEKNKPTLKEEFTNVINCNFNKNQDENIPKNMIGSVPNINSTKRADESMAFAKNIPQILRDANLENKHYQETELPPRTPVLRCFSKKIEQKPKIQIYENVILKNSNKPDEEPKFNQNYCRESQMECSDIPVLENLSKKQANLASWRPIDHSSKKPEPIIKENEVSDSSSREPSMRKMASSTPSEEHFSKIPTNQLVYDLTEDEQARPNLKTTGDKSTNNLPEAILSSSTKDRSTVYIDSPHRTKTPMDVTSSSIDDTRYLVQLATNLIKTNPEFASFKVFEDIDTSSALKNTIPESRNEPKIEENKENYCKSILVEDIEMSSLTNLSKEDLTLEASVEIVDDPRPLTDEELIDQLFIPQLSENAMGSIIERLTVDNSARQAEIQKKMDEVAKAQLVVKEMTLKVSDYIKSQNYPEIDKDIFDKLLDLSLNEENEEEPSEEVEKIVEKSVHEKIVELEGRNGGYWHIMSLEKLVFDTWAHTISLQVFINDDTGKTLDLKILEVRKKKTDWVINYLQQFFLKKLEPEALTSALGQHYTILSLLDYLQITGDRLMDTYVTMTQFRVDYLLKIDDNFKASLSIPDPHRQFLWRIQIDLSDIDNVNEDSVTAQAAVGVVNEENIKKLICNCPRDVRLLESFIENLEVYKDRVSKKARWLKAHDAEKLHKH